jgi:2'-5' RNA ligase
MIPVPEAEPSVAFLRRALAADGAEGMPPHVTLIYPFTDDSRLASGRISEVQAVVRRFRSFEFSFAEVRRFDNLPRESYVWLAPTPALPFVEMVEALAEAFPEHPPFGGAFPTIVPHLTVAASTDETKLRHVEASLSASLPIKASATTVSIMEQVDGTWRLVADAPLAQS